MLLTSWVRIKSDQDDTWNVIWWTTLYFFTLNKLLSRILNTVVYRRQPSKSYWSTRRWLTVTKFCLFLQKNKKNDPNSTLWICSITSMVLSMRCSTRMRTPGRPPITIRHLNAWPNGPVARTPGTQRATLSVYSNAAVLITSLPADKQSDLQKRQLWRFSCHISPQGGWFHIVTITLMS